MLKFKPIDLSRFKQHVVNVPKTSTGREKVLNSMLSHTQTLHNLRKGREDRMDNTAIDIPSKVSIRTTRTRQKPSKIRREEVFNKRVTRDAVRRMKRFHTEERESAYEKRMQCLKKYVNELNLKCDAVKKAEGPAIKSNVNESVIQDRRKFLMSQVSFTQIDEEKIVAQKKYLSKFDHLSKSLPKMTSISTEHFSPTKESQERVMECLRAIDRVYNVLLEMEREGYVLKNNKYVIEYCANGRIWLKKVFLHESDEKKDVFTILVKYYVIETAEEAKSKFAQFAQKSRCEDMRIVHQDIQRLYEHLQHSLTQKKLLELTNITNYIQCRMREDGKYLSRSLRFTLAEQDKTKLTKDIALIEQKYGAMREITKISRRRYDELNRTYSKLQGLCEGN